jgi:hypothetical protein
MIFNEIKKEVSLLNYLSFLMISIDPVEVS